MDITPLQLLEAGGIGLVAGLFGGLAGIGGSMIMLPALHFVFGEKSASTHHMYMAAAMTVNIFVSFPAAMRHYRLKAVRVEMLRWLLPSTGVAIIVGVLVGNLVPGNSLRLALAAFLLVYCGFNVVRLIRGPRPPDPDSERATPNRLMVSGGATGLVGGILGLGGGVLLVPMLQMLCRIRLRESIATSSAVICMTAVVGAGLKLVSLPRLGEQVGDALFLALAMAPTAMIGGSVGALLTHRLPIRVVRAIITVLLLVAAARLAEWV